MVKHRQFKIQKKETNAQKGPKRRIRKPKVKSQEKNLGDWISKEDVRNQETSLQQMVMGTTQRLGIALASPLELTWLPSVPYLLLLLLRLMIIIVQEVTFISSFFNLIRRRRTATTQHSLHARNCLTRVNEVSPHNHLVSQVLLNRSCACHHGAALPTPCYPAWEKQQCYP